ncbi:MAG: hypothetical protein JRN20_18885 [Nitrososphaerota archaeon]|nr:hypothetical protein [Nitrososphaerota archaeon]
MQSRDSTTIDRIRPGIPRGLEFIELEGLRKRTGIPKQKILQFATMELLFNTLDKDDATDIKLQVRKLKGTNISDVSVWDNGKTKLTQDSLELILDFENEASSKRGLKRVSRGYLGNALKCIIGYSYALAEEAGVEPIPATFESAGMRYKVKLRPDKRAGKIFHDNLRLSREKIEDNGFTRVFVSFPLDASSELDEVGAQRLRELVYATSIVNPDRKLVVDILGQAESLGVEKRSKTNKGPRRETSARWYSAKEFSSLFHDYVAIQPEEDDQRISLKDFIEMFRGLTKKAPEILQEVNEKWEKLRTSNEENNHDSKPKNDMQFFPSTPIEDFPSHCISLLLSAMKSRSRRIEKRSVPSVLGCVGKEAFESVAKSKEWTRTRYGLRVGVQVSCPSCDGSFTEEGCVDPDHTEFPFLVELAVFDRKPDDNGGKWVYNCVNFAATTEETMFSSNIFDINYRLGAVGIQESTPVTILTHLVSPVLLWQNYGKSSLAEE